MIAARAPTNCLHCSGWGCRRCRPPHEVAAAAGGDNGFTADELELVALRYRVVGLTNELDETRQRCFLLAGLLAECRQYMRADVWSTAARRELLARVEKVLP